MGPEGQVTKVTAVSDDGNRVFIEYRNGLTSWFDQPEPRFKCGDVLLISTGENGSTPYLMPSNVWPDNLWVGVVKIKLEDITVVEANGRFRTVPTNDLVGYKCDNTVQACDLEGVVRVLSEKPIKYIDLNDEIDDEAVERFLWTAPEGEKLDFDNFGGLKPVVDRARELIELTLLRGNELSAIGVQPIKGVLFTGDPGTGKTMLELIELTLLRGNELSAIGVHQLRVFYSQEIPEPARRCWPESSHHSLGQFSSRSQDLRYSANGTDKVKSCSAGFSREQDRKRKPSYSSTKSTVLPASGMTTHMKPQNE